MLEVGAGEGDGLRGDVDARHVQVGKRGREVGVQEEGDAACSCAEVYDAEGLRWGSETAGSQKL